MPTILKTFKKAIGGFGHKEEVEERTNTDLSSKVLLATALFCIIAIWLLPAIPLGLLGTIIIVIFGFFFATVSSRMVGLVGSSNNPVSGMAIATLIIATALLKATGHTGIAGMTSAICIGTIICIVAAMAGDISQDLKTGYIIGATPKNQQIGEIIGSIVSALAIGGIMFLLDKAWGFGSKELPAPQATLMKLVVEGVMGGSLPWTLVITGVGISVAVEIIGAPVLPVAIGLYLPIHLSVPIYLGGLLRAYYDKKKNGPQLAENGILYSSGLIAGEGLVGIILAILAVAKLPSGDTLLSAINLKGILGNIGGLLFFIALLASFSIFTRKNKKADEK